MDSLRDIRLNRTGLVILAAVSLAATIVILIGGASRTDAQNAARYALAHPAHVVDELKASASGAAAGGSSSTASAPSTADSGGSAGAGGSGGGAGDSDAGTSSGGGSSSAGSTATGGGSTSGVSSASTATTATTAADAGLPKVGHLFLITLSTPNYRTAFGATSRAPYLRALARRGTVLTGFHSLAKHGLADLLAMLSGQRPNADTSSGCQTYAAFPANAKVSSTGLVSTGNGCVYPDAALSVADEVNAAGKTWGAYIADMGTNHCLVPTVGQSLDTPLDGSQEGYDVGHNPFAFFGSLLDAGGCSEYDQDLTDLPAALAKRASTPTFTYLGADACADAEPTLAPTVTTTTTATATTGTTGTTTTTTGTTSATTGTTGTTGTTTTTIPSTGTGTGTGTGTSTTPARLIPPAAYGCPAGETSGLAAEDAFLKAWVPKILASAAYRANGVLIIAFTGADGPARARTGALVLSRWTPQHRTIATAYSPYSMYRSIEDMLDLQPLAEGVTAPSFAKLVLR